MNDKIIELEEYKNNIKNKQDIDNGAKTVDDLSLEELEDVSSLYLSEITKILQEINYLEEENKRLKKLLGKK